MAWTERVFLARLVPEPEGLEDYLGRHIQGYMIPSMFIGVSEICLNVNHEVDQPSHTRCTSTSPEEELVAFHAQQESASGSECPRA